MRDVKYQAGIAGQKPVRELVKRGLLQGKSLSQISREVGISRQGVSYHRDALLETGEIQEVA